MVFSVVLSGCSDTEDSIDASSASQADTTRHELMGSTMGTTWRLVWIDSDSSLIESSLTQDKAGLGSSIEAELARINALMSTWGP